jgi:hypothetical protein
MSTLQASWRTWGVTIEWRNRFQKYCIHDIIVPTLLSSSKKRPSEAVDRSLWACQPPKNPVKYFFQNALNIFSVFPTDIL